MELGEDPEFGKNIFILFLKKKLINLLELKHIILFMDLF